MLPTAHNSIMIHKKFHVCLFCMFTVDRWLTRRSEESPVCHEWVLPLPVCQDKQHKSGRCCLFLSVKVQAVTEYVVAKVRCWTLQIGTATIASLLLRQMIQEWR